jgi:AcrR family transcriptional regulator
MTPVSPREGAQTAKRAQIQADVLRATEELLASGSSYADLNVERIATAAGISRTAFYFYFRDKRDLLMRLAGDVSGRLYEQAEAWFAGEGPDEQEVRTALTRIAELYEEHGTLLRAIVEVSTYDEEIAGYWRTLLGTFVEATAQRIEREQAAGRAAAMPNDAVAFALVWGSERSFYQQLVQQTVPREELIDGLVHLWLAGMYGRIG